MADYVVIYRKDVPGVALLGDLTDVRVGDIIRYLGKNYASVSSRVAKVNVKAHVLRTEPKLIDLGNGVMHETMRSQVIKFDQILDLKRVHDGTSQSPIMDIVHPVPVDPTKFPARKRSRG